MISKRSYLTVKNVEINSIENKVTDASKCNRPFENYEFGDNFKQNKNLWTHPGSVNAGRKCHFNTLLGRHNRQGPQCLGLVNFAD